VTASIHVTDPCPCGRPGSFGEALGYGRCCGRYLDGPPGGDAAPAPAPDAESLMRSRFTAYVRERADYLLATWDDAHRPARLELDQAVGWLGLEVLDHRSTGPDTAQVEFVASFRDRHGRPGRLHERSRFERRGGRWFYLDGDLS
jgi:SEC-C motif domain protein